MCDVEHPKYGAIKVFQASNGARVYGVHEELGTIPFQQKHAQRLIRGLVIAAGFGNSLIRKPSELEKANYTPETPEPEPETVEVSVLDDDKHLSPEPVPEAPGIVAKAKRLFFGVEDALK